MRDLWERRRRRPAKAGRHDANMPEVGNGLQAHFVLPGLGDRPVRARQYLPPPAARAKIDIRSESNEQMDELVELLTTSVDRAREIENQRASGGKVSTRLREIGSRPAALLSEKSPVLCYIRAVDAHLVMTFSKISVYD